MRSRLSLLLVTLTLPLACHAGIVGLSDMMWKTDMYHHFLKTAPINMSVDPCNNFYRHVCPTYIDRYHILDENRRLSASFLLEIQNMFQLRDDIDYPILHMCKSFYPTRAENFTTRTVESCNGDLHCIHKLVEFAITRLTTDAKLNFTTYILPAVEDVDLLLTLLEQAYDARVQDAANSRKEMPNLGVDQCAEYVQLVARQLAMTVLFDSEAVKERYFTDRRSMLTRTANELLRDFRRFRWAHMEDRFGLAPADLVFFLIRVHEERIEFDQQDINELGRLTNIIKNINDKFWKAYRNGPTSVPMFNAMYVLTTEVNRLRQRDEELANKLRDYTAHNAALMSSVYNGVPGRPVISMTHSFSLHSYFGASDPVQYGALYGVLGHEMEHAVQFVMEHLVEHNDFYSINRNNCLSTYTQRLCRHEHFNEADGCPPYNETYTEDDADIVGTKIAYRLFEEDLGKTKLNELAYSDLNLTNNQLFFYALTIGYCTTFRKTQKYINDPHSALHFRPNSIFASMDEFTAAFQCPVGSKMYRRRNFFLEKNEHGKYPEVHTPEQCAPEISGYSYDYDNVTWSSLPLPFAPVERYLKKKKNKSKLQFKSSGGGASKSEDPTKGAASGSALALAAILISIGLFRSPLMTMAVANVVYAGIDNLLDAY